MKYRDVPSLVGQFKYELYAAQIRTSGLLRGPSTFFEDELQIIEDI